jgi:acyl-CoA reductase-like NAD-dependent aldehyde dehydrogenase
MTVVPPSQDWRHGRAEAEVLRIYRPTDGSLVGELAVTPPADIARRVARTRSVQEGWASLDPKDRVRRLRALLGAVGRRAREIEETIVAETGKPRTEAIFEVVTVLDLLRFLVRVTPAFFRSRQVSTGWLVWKKAYVRREPLGVVAVISPWNYPYILSAVPAFTALFAGNGVVLKPSEHTPYSGLLVEDLARDAGLPDDLVQVAIGRGSTGEALVGAGVDRVVFTGGPQTGRRVMAVASERLTPVTLELGGKDAALVLEDAELGRAARGIAWGAFQNAGQTCVGVERVFVVEEVYDAFLRELLAQVREMKAGSVAGVEMGPITTPAQLAVVEEHLADALAGGAQVEAGGGRADPASNVFHPTVLTNVDPGARVLREETFGPLLPVVAVKDAEEAVQRANALPFGLSASVWTRDHRRGMEVAGRLRAGGVCINDALVHYAVPALPFGGVGESGFGRTKGVEGLEELTRTRSFLVDRLGLKREPWWFPYGRSSEGVARASLIFRWKGGVLGMLAGAWVLMRRGRG